MTRISVAVMATALVSLTTAGSAWAHHSFAAAFDMTSSVTVKGTIVQVRLENPHSWFFVDVKDESGKVERWAFEAGTPSGMIRNGFKPSLIKPGAQVTIKGFRARDASQKMGMLRDLTTADGTTYGLFGLQPGPDAR
jgi:DNA/RNA endonuclease YhcR with UshA esterase domain